MSKDSADAATAVQAKVESAARIFDTAHSSSSVGQWVVREKVKNGINTATEVLLTLQTEKFRITSSLLLMLMPRQAGGIGFRYVDEPKYKKRRKLI